MEYSEMITRLRESAGMNRKQFCQYMDIPYRTVSDWEAGLRTMPPYVYSLIEYKLKHEFASGEKAEVPARAAAPVTHGPKEKTGPSTLPPKAPKVVSEKPFLAEISAHPSYTVDSRFDSMPWITKDDDLLRQLTGEGKSPEAMSEKLHRSPALIVARMRKLGIR